MMYFGVILLLCVVYLVNSEKTPEITFITKYQLVLYKKSVEFVCNTTNAFGYPVSWYKVGHNGRKISSSGVLLIDNKDSRYSIRSKGNESYILKIKNVRYEEGGFYECKIETSSNQSVSKKSKLEIAIPPMDITYISEDQIKNIGDNVEFVCDTEFAETVQWYKDPDVISTNSELNDKFSKDPRISVRSDKDDSFTIQIKNVTEADAGSYQCRAYQYNSHYFKHVMLTVKSPQISHISKNQIRSVGEDVELVCDTEYSETVQWYKGPDVISTNSKLNDKFLKNPRISVRSDKDNSYTIQIKSVTEADAGTYKCHAHQHISHTFKEVKLTVLSSPCPGITHISKFQEKNVGDTVELVCDTKNIGNYPIMWLKFDKWDSNDGQLLSLRNDLFTLAKNKYSARLDRNGSYMLQIKDLQESNNGFYGCRISVNGDDFVTEKVKLSVYPGNIIQTPEVQVKNVGETVEFVCDIQNHTYLGVFWSKTDKNGDHHMINNNRKDADLDKISVRQYEEDSYTLRITDIQESDAGVYECVIALLDDLYTVTAKEVTLQVRNKV